MGAQCRHACDRCQDVARFLAPLSGLAVGAAGLACRGAAGQLDSTCRHQGAVRQREHIEGPAHRFNIKGNDYRLVVALAYNTGVVFVKFVGTHKAYDEIDAQTVEPEWLK